MNLGSTNGPLVPSKSEKTEYYRLSFRHFSWVALHGTSASHYHLHKILPILPAYSNFENFPYLFFYMFGLLIPRNRIGIEYLPFVDSLQ